MKDSVTNFVLFTALFRKGVALHYNTILISGLATKPEVERNEEQLIKEFYT
jgi:hypothetical protein